MTDSAKETQIVACPWCGRRNRLARRTADSTYRCGQCRVTIPNPFFGAAPTPQPLPPLRRIRSPLNKGWLAVLGAIAVVAVNWLTTQRQPSVSPAFRTAAQRQNGRSLANGSVIRRGFGQGDGTLRVENGTDSDAVVKLVDSTLGALVVEFYVRHGQTASVDQIPDGTFQVIFAGGDDWDSEAQGFTRDVSFAAFDKRFDFTTKRTGYEVDYSSFTLTLHAVPHGNLSSQPISAADFKRY